MQCPPKEAPSPAVLELLFSPPTQLFVLFRFCLVLFRFFGSSFGRMGVKPPVPGSRYRLNASV